MKDVGAISLGEVDRLVSSLSPFLEERWAAAKKWVADETLYRSVALPPSSILPPARLASPHDIEEMLRARQDVRSSSLRGKFAITLDLAAAFDQIPLPSCIQKYLCFSYQGSVYRAARLPMGIRPAVEVADTISRILAGLGGRCTLTISVLWETRKTR